MQRVGPYSVVRELARAPGAIFAEAKDAEGIRRLLQMLPLATETHPDAESAVERLTTELVHDVPIHGHGGADSPAGAGRVFYWALPWVEIAPAASMAEANRVHRVARRLAEWMAARHRRGRTHVLLSKDVVRIDDKNLVSVVGVPIAVDDDWLPNSVPKAPWAPEERTTYEATLTGDLWRLGQTIRQLADDVDALPNDLRQLLDELTATPPELRPRSAEAVVRRLIDGRRTVDQTPTRRPPSPRRPKPPPPPPPTLVGPPPSGPPKDSTSKPPTKDRPASSQKLQSVGRTERPTFAGARPAKVDHSRIPTEPAARVPSEPMDPSPGDPVGVEVTPLDAAARAPGGAAKAVLATDAAPDDRTPVTPALFEGARGSGEGGSMTVSAAGEAGPSGASAMAPEVSARPAMTKSVPRPSAPLPKREEPATRIGPPPSPNSSPSPNGPTPAAEAGPPAVVGAVEAGPPAVRAAAGLTEAEVDDGPTLSGRSMLLAGRAPDNGAGVPSTQPGAAGMANLDEPFDGVTDLDPEALIEDLPELEPSEVVSVDGDVLDAIVQPVDDVVVAAHTPGDTADEAGAHRPLRAFGGTADLPADIEDPKSSVVSQRSDPDRAQITVGASSARDRTEHVRPVQRGAAATEPPAVGDDALFDSLLGLRAGSGTAERAASLRARPALSARATSARMVAGLRRRVGTVPLLAGVVLAVVALGYFSVRPSARSPVGEGARAQIRPDHWLQLTSEPIGAEVIAEADGRLLGKTPLAMMLPSDADMAVLVYAPERLPMRVVLPDNGALSVTLPAPPKDECTVSVVTTAGAVLEQHRGAQVVPGTVAVRGAAIFRRAGVDRSVGARLVRCPPPGASERIIVDPVPARSRRLRVSAPLGVAVQVEGRALEDLPADVNADHAFVEVRIEDPEGRRLVRWVGLGDDTEVRLPAPGAVEDRVRPGAPSELVLASGASAAPAPANPADESSRTRIRRAKKGAMRYFRRARKALAAGRHREARTAYRRCLKIDRDYAACHRGLGVTYQRLKQPERAAAHFRRYLELRPRASDAPRVRRLLDESLRL